MRSFVVALLLLVAVVASGASRVGDRVPTFSLSAFDGTTVTQTSLAGAPIVIHFWATWCLPCRTALPSLDAIARRFRERGVVVLAVNVDRTRANADAWLAARLPDPAVRLMHDPEGKLLADFGAPGMPAAYLIDRDGVVRFAESGESPNHTSAIEAALESLLR